MSGSLEKKLTQLREAFETGILDEETYNSAKAALENQSARQTKLTGSGSLVQGEENVTAGDGGVAVGGNLHGNVYMGAAPEDSLKALKIYREVMANGCRKVSLVGLNSKAGDITEQRAKLDLEKVYIDLDSTSKLSEKTGERKQKGKNIEPSVEGEPLSLLDAVAANKKIVILGDPGSGKSTFLNHLGLSLSLHGLDPKAGWMDRLPNWPKKEKTLIPIAVILRDFARVTPIKKEKAEPIHLWSFIKKSLEKQNLGFAAEPLNDALEKGEAIGLLDGLDEIPSDSQRDFVLKAVTVFVERYPKSRMIITCRKLTYQNPEWRVENFSSFEAAPFGKDKIQSFIRAWYVELERLGEVTRVKGEFLAAGLAKAVKKQDLSRLASNPLLLTVMAIVNTHKGQLPDSRPVLYEDAVDILLLRWDQKKTDGENVVPPLLELLQEAERGESDLKALLSKLAFDAHGKADPESGDSLADIGELCLTKALAELHPSKSMDWAKKMIETIKFRAGLLLERDREIYTFPHRTFQEYLAGVHLSIQRDFGGVPV